MSDIKKLPILRPKLPDAESIFPFLKRIDRARFYSNFGPLCRELEDQLSAMVRAHVVTFTSGTTALELTLQALGAVPGSLCLCPSWTFIATAAAARHVGLTPYFVDVDEQSWTLTPDRVRRALEMAPGPVGAIIVVAPFGAPMDPAPWEALKRETGVPIIIDAAAGFDGVQVNSIPVMVSLHATKTLGVGEGGFIATRDLNLAKELRSRTVFGFSEGREAVRQGTNAKISEYTAAVGLASLKLWPETRRGFARVRRLYCEVLCHFLPEVALAPGLASGAFETSTFNVILPKGMAEHAHVFLKAKGIDSRFWWAKGCHKQAAYQDAPRGELPNTEALADRVLGLPFYQDLTESDVIRVVEALQECLSFSSFMAPKEGAQVVPLALAS